MITQGANDCQGSAAQHAYFNVVRQAGMLSGASVSESIGAVDEDPAGVWTMLVWIAFAPNEQSPTSWRFSGAKADASVVGVATGDRAWFASTSDFEDGTAVVVSEAGSFVSANDASRLRLDVQNRLIGIMKTDALGLTTPAGGLTFHGPYGLQTCSCWLWNVSSPGMVGPGSYELSLSRVATGHQGWTDVAIALVDPRLPSQKGGPAEGPLRRESEA